MVWEQTWPEGRVVEAGLYDNQDWEAPSGDEDEDEGEGEPIEYLALRLSSTISTFLDHDFGGRIVENRPIEKCSDPVALQVCRESRAITLRHYFRMTHSKLGRSFYLNPDRDIFWPSTDMTDSLGELELLKGYYAECWGRIQSVLVSWEEYASKSYPQHVLPRVTGLRVVQVLLGKEDNEGDQLQTENQGETGDREESADQDVREKENRTEEDDWDMEFARKMMERDSAMAKGLPWTVQYMDQKRNVFCQWSKAGGAVQGVCV